ncbi:hsp90 co-chaperone Cdc37 [Malassezia yamatoensis]|uniref:Hsp90 chaperone protein kinase-targeting subunit n=1 Tax=Malassezia yamatoensis TaxID=253288 RepID=A0AAJ5YVA9_9BASI|nr:hsp90 co-chaperone Cdc37 [Malassezia yamatoensis]
MGKLDYSKWDNLELSDDSDVEVHPNVDKNSFIRWKQRDIHEKREMRKIQRSRLEAEGRTNTDLMPELDRLIKSTESEGIAFYERELKRLLAGREARGDKDGPDGPTLDDMLLSLLLQVNQDESLKSKIGSDEHTSKLVSLLQSHKQKLHDRQNVVRSELQAMDEEDKRKITSDSLHEGWSGGHISKPEPAIEAPKKSETRTSKTQHIETLNPKTSNDEATTSQPGKSEAESDAEDDEDAPSVTPVMKAFASLPSALKSVPLTTTGFPEGFNPAKQLKLDAFQDTFRYLGQHKELLQASYGACDALLMQAFESQMAGQKTLARMCTEKALLIQYCNKLGPDGVSLFFKRMMSQDGRAAFVFLNDVLSTYQQISRRAETLASQSQEQGEGTEQIQLMAEDPSTVISFDVPDGPPPENITLEGEGAETMDIDQVKSWLQRRWDIFNGFRPELREALSSNQLDQVNKVLGAMPVPEAEQVVQDLDQAGILNFRSTEIRDETHR